MKSPTISRTVKGGKRNLVVRLGREKGVWLFIVSLLSAYAAIVAGVILGKIPALGLISLMTLPIAYKTISILRASYQDRVKLAPANLGMICVHNFTAILLAIAYFVVGFKSEALISSILPLAVLFVLYIPVAKLVGRAVLLRKEDPPSVVVTQT